jgi:hypothetical protein
MHGTMLDRPAALPPPASPARADVAFVVAAVIAIVLSGTPAAAVVIVAFGAVGLVRMLAGRPIAAGWLLLIAPPLCYLALALFNDQIGSIGDLIAAANADFRVVGLIPVMIYAATYRLSPDDAARTLRLTVVGVTTGLVVDIAVTVATGTEESLLLSSHHAVGFAAVLTAVIVFAMPPSMFPLRSAILVVAALALFVSGSRSGVAAGVAAFCAIPVLRALNGLSPGWSISRILRFTAACAGVGALAMLVSPASVERVTETVSDVVDSGLNTSAYGRPTDSGEGVSVADRNVAVRLGVWETLSEDAGATALLRFDAGTVDDVLTDAREPAHSEFSAHNIFLQLVVELGWVGMLLYVAISTIGVRLLMRRCAPSTRVAMAAIWVAVLAFGLTSNSMLSPAVMVPAVFFLLLLACDPERLRT